MKADILIKHIKNSQWGVVLANAKVVIYASFSDIQIINYQYLQGR